MNEIQFLFGAVERVPEITPNRSNLISEIVQDCQNLTVSNECPKVYLGGGEKESHSEDSVVQLSSVKIFMKHLKMLNCEAKTSHSPLKQ